MDRLDAMRAFVWVADLRGFAPAARRLGVSPPMVTRLVAGLEERLATRLLQRTTRSVSLTDAGARFVERARRLVADADEAEQAVHAERVAPTGRFVVTAPNGFGRREVAPLLCRFLADHPAVVGELRLTDRLVDLVDEAVDVAVRIGALDDSSLTVRRVGETRRVVVAAPSYLARRPVLRRPVDLARHAIIQFTALTPGREWRFDRHGRETRVRIQPVFVTNSADAAVGHAELGGGVAMVLGYQAADAVRAGRLQVVLAGFEPPPLPIQLAYPSARMVSASLRAFIELTVAQRRWRFTSFEA